SRAAARTRAVAGAHAGPGARADATAGARARTRPRPRAPARAGGELADRDQRTGELRATEIAAGPGAQAGAQRAVHAPHVGGAARRADTARTTPARHRAARGAAGDAERRGQARERGLQRRGRARELRAHLGGRARAARGAAALGERVHGLDLAVARR